MTHAPAAPEQTPIDPAAVGDDEIHEQKAVRLAKRERLIAKRTDAGGGAFPVGVPVTHTIPALRATYGEGGEQALEAGAETGVVVGVAGRVVFSRNTGKLCFATLQAGDGSRIQAMISLANVGEESLAEWKEYVDLGDHVFVHGEVISSRRGELSLVPSSRTRTPSTPSSTCASLRSSTSSAPSSAASSGSTRSTATSATRGPTRRTAPSSRCSRPTRRTATTSRWRH